MHISEVPFKKDIDCSGEIKNKMMTVSCNTSHSLKQVRQGNNRGPVIKYVKGIINLFYCAPNGRNKIKG